MRDGFCLKLAAIALMALAACTPPKSVDDRTGNAEPDSAPAARQAATIYGRWDIIAVNGVPPRVMPNDARGKPGLVFSPGQYGGSSGCNGFGGTGLFDGNHWFGMPPLQTLIGCGSLMAQESAIIGIVANGPKITFDGKNKATLTTPIGTLDLKRTADAEIVEVFPRILAGSRWELGRIDRAFTGETTLTFEADDWILTSPCATRSGRWTQEEGAIRLDRGTEQRKACASEFASADALLSAFAGKRLRYVVGANDDLVLSDSNHWAVGQQNISIWADDDRILSGEWHVASVDGVALQTQSRPASLHFGSGGFSVWDGCSHQEGIAIVSARQLFTQASGVETLAICPPDPVRAKIRDIVSARPRIARTRTDGLALITRQARLDLVRVSRTPFGAGTAAFLKSGMTIELATGALPGAKPARLEIGPGQRFRVVLSCGTIQGHWLRARGQGIPQARFGPDGFPPGCDTDTTARALDQIFTGDIQMMIGPNLDIVLFMNRRQAVGGRISPAADGPKRP